MSKGKIRSEIIERLPIVRMPWGAEVLIEEMLTVVSPTMTMHSATAATATTSRRSVDWDLGYVVLRFAGIPAPISI